ncbi:transcriptional regulator [Bradymonadaceae bacterium TMQ3]|uniref:Transcriptional regulator n=1 Tax=Lujinxingia sediminis TaxID=2480984 RepID=A0ABY0CTQ4_9DELT|nr:helix-turn-helix domain-containing protein [Lujinxingia sediminis]RDV37613.1 transcriptional regulator [Bradymonadaceae bacterium TMQ3]RVU45704.1 transcriptional regulator [Lujinxingia sediminis]TXC75165.1 helix-turn-helix transcriptional regulator [Bradymonadales bacterium TMQ1]
MKKQEPIHSVAELGARIREARQSQGLTQQEFADVCGVGVRFLSEVERGKESAEIGLVLRLLSRAGLDVIVLGRHHEQSWYWGESRYE